jgi:hypothetical protein
MFISLVNEVADRMQTLIDKITRAREYQCAQIFFNQGVVTLSNGVNIDYRRKGSTSNPSSSSNPTSISDVAADYFATNNDPYAVFVKGCDFLRKTGKSGDGTFQAVIGTTGWQDLLNNTKFTDRQKLFQIKLDDVTQPNRSAVGAVYMGTITAGSYKVQLWTYPQFYDQPAADSNGNTQGNPLWIPTYTQVPYVPVNQCVLFPSMPRFKTVCCATPKLIGAPGDVPVQAEYSFMDKIDEWNATHLMAVSSAPLAIPVAVDTIYNFRTST